MGISRKISVIGRTTERFGILRQEKCHYRLHVRHPSWSSGRGLSRFGRASKNTGTTTQLKVDQPCKTDHSTLHG
ncbi:hypothetical protein KP79_PYT03405 [Mizuhopecten yessoensis]|uniref:Uncharacterized protein n=1 Tax=Mizuhopecten yessoensis TaxID=6573 RepID=A0A210PDI8_MIZYE|nr:hypothetical protein KP79_PYT03405 [Mizuhopecten yessoensis]